MSVAAATTAARAAFAQHDFTLLAARLADDVVFRSPVTAEPWRSRAVVAVLGAAMVTVIESIEFTDELVAADTAHLVFTAAHGGETFEGVLILRVRASGEISVLTMLVRPLSALARLASAMRHALEHPPTPTRKP